MIDILGTLEYTIGVGKKIDHQGGSEMKMTYVPKGVCSNRFDIDVEDGIIKHIDIVGGCPGNLFGLSRLVEGKKVTEVIKQLEGITCGQKKTSCPDQLAQALKTAIE